MASEGKPQTLESLLADFVVASNERMGKIESTLERLATRKTAKRSGKAAPKVKYDLGLGPFMPSKGIPSAKGMAKVKAWATNGDVARLREYAGIGPSVKGKDEPARVAVFEPNRLLAQRIVEKAFDEEGKPLSKYMTPITTRDATPEAKASRKRGGKAASK